jgi:hypothetical protein
MDRVASASDSYLGGPAKEKAAAKVKGGHKCAAEQHGDPHVRNEIFS